MLVVMLMPCYREEGFANGLYRGIAANFSCSCVQGAAEIVTYDLTKETAIKHGFTDSTPLHLTAGVTATSSAVWYHSTILLPNDWAKCLNCVFI
jgi:hypothetical protein